MMALRRRRADVPDDPLAPVLTRTISTTRPVTSMASPWPGIWAGEGCAPAGLRAGTAVDAERLEKMVAASSGFDICLTEPLDFVRLLAIHNAARDGLWHDSLMTYVLAAVPVAFADAVADYGLDLDLAGAKFVAAVYTHPVADCWPVDSTIWHAHCLVPGQVWCSAPH